MHEDLYYGNIAPSDKTFPPQSKYAKAMKTVDACEDALTAALDAEGQKTLQTLMAAQREVSDLSIREAFVDGFGWVQSSCWQPSWRMTGRCARWNSPGDCI